MNYGIKIENIKAKEEGTKGTISMGNAFLVMKTETDKDLPFWISNTENLLITKCTIYRKGKFIYWLILKLLRFKWRIKR